MFSKVTVFIFPPAMYEISSCFISLPTLGIVRHIMISYGFNVHFSNVNDAEYLCMCLVAIHISTLKCLFKCFGHVLVGLLFFLLSSVSYLYTGSPII